MEEGREYFESSNSDSDQNMIEENQSGSEEEMKENQLLEDEGEKYNQSNIQFKYNELEFQKRKILDFLFENDLIKNNPKCEVCDNQMKLVKMKSRIDGKIWRCKKKGNDPHDIKLNIRKGSIFEDIKADIRILYFLIFYNFVENKSVKESYINTSEFCSQFKLEKMTKKHISKFYQILRNKIKETMHNEWNQTQLGTEPCNDGKCYCEIDESKIINYNNETRWMLGIYDRGTHDIRIFYVDNNRTKETLLPIIEKHIYSYYNNIENNEDPNEENYPTRIFSDYFQAYQVNDFNSLGYKLYKVNHSIWFGQGHFHTNSIEGTWSKLKRLTRSFNGLNGNVFNTKRNNLGNNDYFEGWICTGIFFMKCESLHLPVNEKKKFLIDYVKCKD